MGLQLRMTRKPGDRKPGENRGQTGRSPIPIRRNTWKRSVCPRFPAALTDFFISYGPLAIRRCHSLHSNHMLNRGYAFTTIVSSKDHGQTLLSHLASFYPHSTPQAWQQNLNNREVTVNGVTATGSESLTLGQTLIWSRPPWIEPDSPQHFEVLFEDPHLLAVNKPSGLPTLPGGGFMEN